MINKPKFPFDSNGFIYPSRWYQGAFIDSPRYNHMGEDWKEEQRKREKTLMRDSRTGNGVFQVTNSPEGDATIIEAILALRDYAVELERYIERFNSALEGEDPLVVASIRTNLEKIEAKHTGSSPIVGQSNPFAPSPIERDKIIDKEVKDRERYINEYLNGKWE